jgi:hypothetical protein
MTDEQMRELVKECGLDWQRGYMPLFDGDPTNRYAVLIEAVEAAERERLLSELRRMHDEQADRSVRHNYYLYAANVLAGKILPQGEAPSTLPLVTLDQAESMVAAERERCASTGRRGYGRL